MMLTFLLVLTMGLLTVADLNATANGTTSAVAGTTPAPSSEDNKPGGLDIWMWAVIGVGGLIFIILLLGLIYWYRFKHHHHRSHSHDEEESQEDQEPLNGNTSTPS
jgi:TRAP-type C4-dicarboxylate transport system permease small subunit